MSASRTAGDADTIGMDLVLLGVGPQPADSRFDIVDGRRELVLWSQPISHGDSDVALFGQADAQAVVALA